MSLKRWLQEAKIIPHKTSREEIYNLFQLVQRDIKDASCKQISTDRRFATAYNAVLQLATIVLHASGYRAKAAIGHHRITIDLLPEFLGKEYIPLTDYFNTCRSKRNVTDYDLVGSVADEEVQELLHEVHLFQTEVTKWLKQKHSHLLEGK